MLSLYELNVDNAEKMLQLAASLGKKRYKGRWFTSKIQALWLELGGEEEKLQAAYLRF